MKNKNKASSYRTKSVKKGLSDYNTQEVTSPLKSLTSSMRVGLSDYNTQEVTSPLKSLTSSMRVGLSDYNTQEVTSPLKSLTSSMRVGLSDYIPKITNSLEDTLSISNITESLFSITKSIDSQDYISKVINPLEGSFFISNITERLSFITKPYISSLLFGHNATLLTSSGVILLEWDVQKNVKNFFKHQISFEDAKNVFNDPYRIVKTDEKHSTNEEKRKWIIGALDDGIWVVVFTKRIAYRIISARKANKKEKMSYSDQII